MKILSATMRMKTHWIALVAGAGKEPPTLEMVQTSVAFKSQRYVGKDGSGTSARMLAGYARKVRLWRRAQSLATNALLVQSQTKGSAQVHGMPSGRSCKQHSSLSLLDLRLRQLLGCKSDCMPRVRQWADHNAEGGFHVGASRGSIGHFLLQLHDR